MCQNQCCHARCLSSHSWYSPFTHSKQADQKASETLMKVCLKVRTFVPGLPESVLLLVILVISKLWECFGYVGWHCGSCSKLLYDSKLSRCVVWKNVLLERQAAAKRGGSTSNARNILRHASSTLQFHRWNVLCSTRVRNSVPRNKNNQQ